MWPAQKPCFPRAAWLMNGTGKAPLASLPSLLPRVEDLEHEFAILQASSCLGQGCVHGNRGALPVFGAYTQAAWLTFRSANASDASLQSLLIRVEDLRHETVGVSCFAGQLMPGSGLRAWGSRQVASVQSPCSPCTVWLMSGAGSAPLASLPSWLSRVEDS